MTNERGCPTSIQSLLASEPPCTLCRRPAPGETDEAGVPLDTEVIQIRTIRGRLSVNSGQQREMWKALGVEADYLFTSTDGGARASMLIRSNDGRLFRVNGNNSQEYPKGNIRPSTFEYPLVEVTVGNGLG